MNCLIEIFALLALVYTIKTDNITPLTFLLFVAVGLLLLSEKK